MADDFTILQNSTSQRIPIWLADSSSTIGAALPSITATGQNLACFYWREDGGTGTALPVTLVVPTLGAYSSGGWIPKDNANAAGEYEFGIPNIVLTTGAKWARLYFKGATNQAPKVVSIRITQLNLDAATLSTVGDVLRVGTASVVTTANDVLRVGTVSVVTTANDVLRVGTVSVVATVNDVLRVGTVSLVADVLRVGTASLVADVLRLGTASVVTTANDVLRVGTVSLVADVLRTGTASVVSSVADVLRVGTVSVVAAANFPTNFLAMAITAGGLVDITQGAADKVWSTTTRTLSRNAGIKKNTALAGFQFRMTDSTNHNPATGLTVTAARSLNGAAFGACANSPTEIGSGWYTIDLAAADLNADTVALKFTAAAADDAGVSIATM